VSTRTFRWTGPLGALSGADRDALLDRSTSRDERVRTTTEAILDLVRRDGDEALLALAREYDRARLSSLEVPRERWDAALAALAPELRRAMERAAANITLAHRAQLPVASEVETEPGVVIGRRPDPLRRVGVYAPGGRAAYPSSVLMGVIPARVAGVEEIVVCTPPDASGAPSAVVLAAAALAGAHRVFAIGGAGAIAAMAFGTASVPRVDRIVGPGNAFVAEAKVQVASVCAIDSPAGPSELLVIADDAADATTVAREVVAQAEHDPDAAVVVVTWHRDVAQRVEQQVRAVLPTIARHAIAARSLAARGGVLVAETADAAVTFANEYAPEHLLLAVREPAAMFREVRNAGTVFLGETSSVAFGDYMTGANHVLPTGGLARAYSGLGTLDFVRWTTYQRIDGAAAPRLAGDVGAFADAEGLDGHASAARAWGRA
jgi:histidinol dehydrogenase